MNNCKNPLQRLTPHSHLRETSPIERMFGHRGVQNTPTVESSPGHTQQLQYSH